MLKSQDFVLLNMKFLFASQKNNLNIRVIFQNAPGASISPEIPSDEERNAAKEETSNELDSLMGTVETNEKTSLGISEQVEILRRIARNESIADTMNDDSTFFEEVGLFKSDEKKIVKYLSEEAKIMFVTNYRSEALELFTDNLGNNEYEVNLFGDDVLEKNVGLMQIFTQTEAPYVQIGNSTYIRTPQGYRCFSPLDETGEVGNIKSTTEFTIIRSLDSDELKDLAESRENKPERFSGSEYSLESYQMEENSRRNFLTSLNIKNLATQAEKNIQSFDLPFKDEALSTLKDFKKYLDGNRYKPVDTSFLEQTPLDIYIPPEDHIVNTNKALNEISLYFRKQLDQEGVTDGQREEFHEKVTNPLGISIKATQEALAIQEKIAWTDLEGVLTQNLGSSPSEIIEYRLRLTESPESYRSVRGVLISRLEAKLKSDETLSDEDRELLLSEFKNLLQSFNDIRVNHEQAVLSVILMKKREDYIKVLERYLPILSGFEIEYPEELMSPNAIRDAIDKVNSLVVDPLLKEELLKALGEIDTKLKSIDKETDQRISDWRTRFQVKTEISETEKNLQDAEILKDQGLERSDVPVHLKTYFDDIEKNDIRTQLYTEYIQNNGMLPGLGSEEEKSIEDKVQQIFIEKSSELPLEKGNHSDTSSDVSQNINMQTFPSGTTNFRTLENGNTAFDAGGTTIEIENGIMFPHGAIGQAREWLSMPAQKENIMAIQIGGSVMGAGVEDNQEGLGLMFRRMGKEKFQTLLQNLSYPRMGRLLQPKEAEGIQAIKNRYGSIDVVFRALGLLRPDGQAAPEKAGGKSNEFFEILTSAAVGNFEALDRFRE